MQKQGCSPEGNIISVDLYVSMEAEGGFVLV